MFLAVYTFKAPMLNFKQTPTSTLSEGQRQLISSINNFLHKAGELENNGWFVRGATFREVPALQASSVQENRTSMMV